MIIDFDTVAIWGPSLSEVLKSEVTEQIKSTIAASNLKYYEDAFESLSELVDNEIITDKTLEWIRTHKVYAYHGSRLTDEDVKSIESIGLIPLKAENRRNRLIRALSSHPNWALVSQNLDKELGKLGFGRCVPNQVHLTLSKSGLVNGFNQYLTYGSDFDQKIAYSLLGQEGIDLLKSDGNSYVFRFAIPGDKVLEATNTSSSIENQRARGEMPDIINKFLSFWINWIAHPDFQINDINVDCGLIFNESVPANWLTNTEKVN